MINMPPMSIKGVPETVADINRFFEKQHINAVATEDEIGEVILAVPTNFLSITYYPKIKPNGFNIWEWLDYARACIVHSN